jgi:uncharacterized protein YbaP (TraB family)
MAGFDLTLEDKADQPDTFVDFFDAYRLTCERSAEVDFLSENANPSAVGDHCFIVVGVNHTLGPDSIELQLREHGVPVRATGQTPPSRHT